MSILLWLLFGITVGAVAKLLTPGTDPAGFLVTMLIGIAGSLLGGAISYAFLGPGEDGAYHPAGWIMSIVGAVVLLVAYRLLTRGRRVS